MLSAYIGVTAAQLQTNEKIALMQSELRNMNTRLDYQTQLMEERRIAEREKAALEQKYREAQLEKYDKANADFQRKMLAR